MAEELLDEFIHLIDTDDFLGKLERLTQKARVLFGRDLTYRAKTDTENDRLAVAIGIFNTLVQHVQKSKDDPLYNQFSNRTSSMNSQYKVNMLDMLFYEAVMAWLQDYITSGDTDLSGGTILCVFGKRYDLMHNQLVIALDDLDKFASVTLTDRLPFLGSFILASLPDHQKAFLSVSDILDRRLFDPEFTLVNLDGLDCSEYGARTLKRRRESTEVKEPNKEDLREQMNLVAALAPPEARVYQAVNPASLASNATVRPLGQFVPLTYDVLPNIEDVLNSPYGSAPGVPIDVASQFMYESKYEPSLAPSKPSLAPSKPSLAPSKPSLAPSRPSLAPSRPILAPSRPILAPSRPILAPSRPSLAASKPSLAASKPSLAPSRSGLAPSRLSILPGSASIPQSVLSGGLGLTQTLPSSIVPILLPPPGRLSIKPSLLPSSRLSLNPPVTEPILLPPPNRLSLMPSEPIRLPAPSRLSITPSQPTLLPSIVPPRRPTMPYGRTPIALPSTRRSILPREPGDLAQFLPDPRRLVMPGDLPQESVYGSAVWKPQ